MEQHVDDSMRLGRYLSPLSAWALSFGCAVGWGAFVMPGTALLPLAGPLGTLIGLAAGAAVMFLVGRNYHYLIQHFPDVVRDVLHFTAFLPQNRISLCHNISQSHSSLLSSETDRSSPGFPQTML